MEARGVCGCLGICGRFRLHHLPSWGLDPGERLQYCGLVGKWQHSGNGPRKASSYESPRPKTHADQLPRPRLEGRSATSPKPIPRQAPGAPVSPAASGRVPQLCVRRTRPCEHSVRGRAASPCPHAELPTLVLLSLGPSSARSPPGMGQKSGGRHTAQSAGSGRGVREMLEEFFRMRKWLRAPG